MRISTLELAGSAGPRLAFGSLDGESTFSRAFFAPCRPFAFYITEGADCVELVRLMLGADQVLAGVPGSLLAPRPDDRLAEADPWARSNLGEQAPRVPGVYVSVFVRNLTPEPVPFRALLVATEWTPIDDAADREKALRRVRLRLEQDTAERLWLELVDAATASHVPSKTDKELRALARELAGTWHDENLAELGALELLEPPPVEAPPFRPGAWFGRTE